MLFKAFSRIVASPQDTEELSAVCQKIRAEYANLTESSNRSAELYAAEINKLISDVSLPLSRHLHAM